MTRHAATLLIAAALGGCASTTQYSGPMAPAAPAVNSIDIPRARADVWKTAVPALAKQFFVINNIDQSSGLINLSYTGDAGRYVDCGNVVVMLGPEVRANFPASSPNENFTWSNGVAVFMVNRRVTLEGRINLVFEERKPGTTTVSVNSRYILTRELTARNAYGVTVANDRHTAAFSTSERGTFAASSASTESVTCHPTGQLEADILQILK